MEKIIKIVFCTIIFSSLYSSCKEEEENNPQISPIDISQEILGEWVLDNPVDSSWQSMKFTESGKFYYSENKGEWSNILKRTDGNYTLNGYNVSGYRALGTLYVDMTIQEINDYSFTTRFKNTDLEFVYNKVLMRTHLNFAESVIPPYTKLIDKNVISYKSHDETIASVDSITGEITATGMDGRTYIDVTTNEGTACIKVMVGTVNDGDENEINTIPTKRDTIQIENVDVGNMIVGHLWVYDHPEEKIWEIIQFTKSGKVYFSNSNGDWDFENEKANGNYSIDQKTIAGTVLINGIVPMDFYWVVTNIQTFEYTIKSYSSGEFVGRFTYSKQLAAVEMNVGDKKTLEYQQLVGKATIIGFESHNTSLLSVNNETGEMTAVSSGRTYIDIITEEGTAVVEVKISNPIFYIAFDEYVWADKDKVKDNFGNQPLSETDNEITYGLPKGEFKSATFTFEEGIVSRIVLMPKGDSHFTTSEMLQVLSDRYTEYPKMTDRTKKTYINGRNEEEANVVIAYYPHNKRLYFVQLKQ